MFIPYRFWFIIRLKFDFNTVTVTGNVVKLAILNRELTVDLQADWCIVQYVAYSYEICACVLVLCVLTRMCARARVVCVCVCARKVWSCYSWRLDPSVLDPEDEGNKPFRKSTHRNAPEYLNLQQHSCEILKSLMLLFLTTLRFVDTMTAFCTAHSIY